MYNHKCSNCGMSHICLPLGLGKNDLSKLESIVNSSAVKHAGDIVLLQGDPFTKVYAVKAGMCKSYRFDEAGIEYVQSFHLPGELFGLEAIHSKRYGFSVEALDTAVLCEMDFSELQNLCSQIPGLQNQLLNLLSREIYNSHVSPIEHFDQTAEQKLAGFLHNLFARYQARGHLSANIYLPMSRKDIANHLGLAAETISRLLKRFHQSGVISIDNRLIEVKNSIALEKLVHCHALEQNMPPTNSALKQSA